jgi:fucose permease
MPKRLHFVASLLALAFALTGVAVGLVGALLPAIMAQFGVHDRGAGTVMLLAWGGSTVGVLLCRGRVDRSILRGTVTTAVALGALAFATRPTALALFALYGVGLGITMTSISVRAVVGMDREERRRTLNRLNMLWALGAVASPTLGAHALRSLHVGAVFASLGVAFGLIVFALLLTGGETTAVWDEPESQGAMTLPPRLLCVFAALAVGVESALGGWLTTYSGRTAHGTALTVSAATAFWTGLLLSRTFHASQRAARWSVRAHGMLAAASLGALLAAPQGPAFLLLALAAGWGLGPLYPFALSRVLTEYRPRAIFLCAGIGSATVPWLTGIASGAWGSLRLALMVPLAAAVLLIATGEALRRRTAV